MTDDILTELRAVRADLAREYGNDAHKLGDALRELTRAEGWSVVQPPDPQPVTSSPMTAGDRAGPPLSASR